MGVVYHPGTWHAGITVLDSEATFAVMMWRGGEDDDVFAPIEVNVDALPATAVPTTEEDSPV